MDRRFLLLVLVWAACAVAAAGMGFGAASLVGDAIGDPPAGADTHRPSVAATVTSPSAIHRSTSPTPGPTDSSAPRSNRPNAPRTSSAGSPTVTAPAAPTTRSASRSTAGGVVYATCGSGLVKVTPSPAPGWRLDSWTRGTVPVAEVEFRSNTSKVEVSVRCGSNGPVFAVDSGSGGDDGGGPDTTTSPSWGGGGGG